jgi:hypothetical protein
MMPTEFMSRTMPMLADALPQLLDLVYQFLTRQPFQIVVHDPPPSLYSILAEAPISKRPN